MIGLLADGEDKETPVRQEICSICGSQARGGFADQADLRPAFESQRYDLSGTDGLSAGEYDDRLSVALRPVAAVTHPAKDMPALKGRSVPIGDGDPCASG